MDRITEEHLDRYFSITKEALEMARKAPKRLTAEADDILDMAGRYVSDAEHFASKGDRVLAFAALNYAHGWLDCGARLKAFIVNDSRLFTVDDD